MRSGWGLGLLLVLLATPVPSASQGGPARDPDLVDLALRWARGDYRSPLLCEFDGQARRGLRRVLIAPGPRDGAQRTARITFFDLEAEGASRCFSELRQEQPNLTGMLEITLVAASRPDTALRDFKAALRREGGFEYPIQSGRLRVGAVGEAANQMREIDFRGGTASLTRIAPGSDAARLLAEFETRRKLHLTLEAPDETRIVVDLVEVAPR